MNGKIKIGKTTKPPEIRAEQLSKQTSNIGHFKVEWSKKVNDASFYENYLHYVFKIFHYEKEFFSVQSDLAIKIAETTIKIINDAHNKVYNEIQNSISINNKKIKGFDAVNKISSSKDKKITERLKDFKNDNVTLIKVAIDQLKMMRKFPLNEKEQTKYNTEITLLTEELNKINT